MINCAIIGIADENGSVIATYTYDEWGKLLSIETAEENNSEQLKIAEINPLRYRGYYYDNETGYYYLQSRYYDPDLADLFLLIVLIILIQVHHYLLMHMLIVLIIF
ncbi:MAG: hypothetical protein HFJ97_04960 [Eubacterium sp.]|nr:hypothetical protein [Eubacterium sp.]